MRYVYMHPYIHTLMFSSVSQMTEFDVPLERSGEKVRESDLYVCMYVCMYVFAFMCMYAKYVCACLYMNA